MIVDTADTVNCPVCASPEIQQTWSYDGGYPTSQGRSVMACPECGWSHPGDSIEQINPLLVKLRRRATLAKLGHPEWDNLDRERELRENHWDGDGEPQRRRAVAMAL
ncbi:MAG: hypothetical protein ACREQ3_21565 [Candidatus Binatia bacterium]